MRGDKNDKEFIDGNYYKWLTEKRLEKNSKYLVVTDDMGTESIYDDEMVLCVKL